jgi:uncharacterized protein (TIGR00251 family)
MFKTAAVAVLSLIAGILAYFGAGCQLPLASLPLKSLFVSKKVSISYIMRYTKLRKAVGEYFSFPVIVQNWYSVVKDFIHIDLKVFPGSSKNEFFGIRDNRLCVRVASAPENGKANACLCRFIAKFTGCAGRDVIVIKGEKSRLKTVSIPAAFYEDLTKNILTLDFMKPENVQ